MGHGPDQQRLDFNPVEATPEERERTRRIALEWTREKAEEDFVRLPGETLEEFLPERDVANVQGKYRRPIVPPR